MTCFEVSINEKLVCRAGVDADIGFLAAMLDLLSHQPKAGSQRKRDGLGLRVGGSETNNGRTEQLVWLDRRVRVGDVITIRIVKASGFDKPKNRKIME